MWLILCSPSDEPAVWLALKLQRAGLRPLRVLTPEMLCFPRASSFDLSDDSTSSRLELLDGTVLESHALRGVINRVEQLPALCFSGAQPADREYAAQEMAAHLSAWLRSLPCPVLNPPSPGWVGGRPRAWLQWSELAAQAGLATFPARLSCHPLGSQLFIDPSPLANPQRRRRIFVCGSWCASDVGVVSPALAASVIQLATRADTPLLEVELIASDATDSFERFSLSPMASAWTGQNAGPQPGLEYGATIRSGPWLAAADPWFDFRRGGAPFIGALIALLTSGRHRSPLSAHP